MAISYPIAFPVISGVESVVLRTRPVVAVSESPFTLTQQAQAHQGQRWEASVNIPTRKRSIAEYWVAFLLKLNGRQGTFLFGDPNGATPRGSASSSPGTPVVDGAGQTGNQLNISGAPSGASGYLLAGDYIQLGSGSGSRLFKVLDDVNTDSVGDFTALLWPSLRSSPANGATVVVSAAQGVFRLDKNLTEWGISQQTFYDISFNAVEVL